jgi:hypothetical protein
MRTFKSFIKENYINIKENFGDDHDFSGLKPHHSFQTDDGHKVDIHVFNNEHGKHAIFYNKNLKGITKLVHWSKDSEHPSKSELEKSGHEEGDMDEHLSEDYIIEKITPNSAGKIAEHSAVMHMIGHMHKQNNTYGSTQHKKDIEPHKKAIRELGKDATPQEVGLRVRHGQEMANAALQSLHLKHGPHMKISRVGHTAQSGDIEKFTKGKHKDSQINPSDMAVHVMVPKKLKESSGEDDNHEHHYEGFSLKSSAKSSNITTKNPGIDFGGDLHHHSRELKTKDISSKGAKETHKKVGLEGTTPKHRESVMRAAREKEGVKHGSSIEKTANAHNATIHEKISKELHNHIKHLTTKVGDSGHHLIGKMLEKHLVPKTSMPWSKIHVKGEHEGKIHSTVTPGSDHPMNKTLKNKKTRFASTLHKNTVTIHKVEKDGSHTPLAHYRPRTGGKEAILSTGHKWDVTMSKTHSKK